MPLKMSNNATSLLSSSINATDLVVSITAGDETMFPTLGVGDWHPITITKSTGEREVMRCNSRSGVNLTVVRGQEGTTPLSFVAGDARVDVRLTGAALNEIAIHDKIYSVPADLGVGFRTGSSRFVVNDNWDLSGTDILSLNNVGAMTLTGQLIVTNNVVSSQNFLGSGSTVLLAPTTSGTIYLQPAGYGVSTGQAYLTAGGAHFSSMLYADGGLSVTGSLDFANVTVDSLTVQDPGSGNALAYFRKTASGKTNELCGMTGAEHRWILELGNAAPESGTAYVGSNITLYRYNNAGGAGDLVLQITRTDGRAYFYHGLSAIGGDFVTDGGVVADSNFISSDVVAILAAANGGTVYLRPNGVSSSAGQLTVASAGDVNTNGELTVNPVNGKGIHAGMGLQLKQTASGTSYNAAGRGNLGWSGTYPQIVINDTAFTVTGISCDYRIKKEVKPLDRAWEKIKRLRPISYQQRDYAGLFKADGVERWGFIAHELQEDLLPSAAAGRKDEANVLQSPDLMAVVAALTSALQEAQLRIEALEARLA